MSEKVPAMRDDDQAAREETGSVGSWALAVAMGLLALLGLVMASGAQDGVFYGTGLGLFIFGVLFIFVLIKQMVGR
jgi:hypothetical protein